MPSRYLTLAAVLMVTAMILPGCRSSAPRTVEKVVTQVVEKEIRIIETRVVEKVVEHEKFVEVTPASAGKHLHLRSIPGDIPTIDPALAIDVVSIQVIEETTVGLVRQNETNASLESAMATGWDVSDNGLVYTFHLRDDVPWVRYDGTQVVKVQDCEGKDRMVTAGDFAYGILRTLNPATASKYAYVLTPVIAGAADFNSGAVADPATVGVKALDPITLEITFQAPAVYNLNILGLWVAHAQPQWLIEGDGCTEARGDRWTEQGFFQGYGPYTLEEWVHDARLTIVKNPFWPGADHIPQARIDRITWNFLDVGPAFAEFEAGRLDVSPVPAADIDRVRADPELSTMLEYVYELGTEFYGFNTQLAPTDDLRVRKALSMAIDRQAIVDNINNGSGEPAPWFSHPGLVGSPNAAAYPDLGIKYDPVAAKALLDEYLQEKGQAADQISLVLMFNTSEMHQRRAEAVQQMWANVLGINVELLNQELQVYLQQRQEGKEHVYRGTWIQDYPDANNFLRDVFGAGGGYANVVDWQNDRFNELLAQGAIEADAEKRTAIYAEAEKILVEDEAVIAPLYWYSTPVLFRPHVKHPVSITGYDHYEKWDIE